MFSMHPSNDESTVSEPTGVRLVEPDLTREEARGRRDRLGRVSYEIALSFDRDHDSYKGRTNVVFQVVKEGEPLFLDFRGRSPGIIELNGEPLPPAVHDGIRIHGPEDRLVNGENRLMVEYTNDYDRIRDKLRYSQAEDLIQADELTHP